MTARRSYPIQVGVLGAGAMGSGIALVAAKAGHDVILADAESRALMAALRHRADNCLALR